MKNKTINIFLILLLLSLIFVYRQQKIENMASVDEAISNVASIYNAGAMTVTNITATKDLTVQGGTNVQGVNAQGITAKGLTVQGDANISGIMTTTRGYFKGGDAGGGGQTHFPYTDGTNYIRGHTTHNGNFNLGGTLTVNGRNILAELDDLKANSVRYGQNVEGRPINDAGKCFDFGSDGRVGCDSTWSIVKINKR